jgi:hypothetical protein
VKAHVQIEWEVVAVSVGRDTAQRVELHVGVYDERGELCVQATGIVKLSVQT